MTRKRQYTKRRRPRKADVLKVVMIISAVLGLVKVVLQLIKLLT